MDSDGEEILSSSSRASRKSSLITRLQSGQSLQICFLNENVTDFTSQVSYSQSLYKIFIILDLIRKVMIAVKMMSLSWTQRQLILL
jgi:hypothetical protein